MSFKEYLPLSGKEPVKRWKQSLSNFSFPYVVGLGVNDYWAILFIGCISLFAPKILWVLPIYFLLKTHKRLIIKSHLKSRPELGQIVTFIKMNHLQSLSEALESNPSLIYCEYKKKSLMSWCEHYNNASAQKIISQISSKNTSEKRQMAA